MSDLPYPCSKGNVLSLFNFCERTGIKFFGAIRLLKLVILERFSIAFMANGKRQAEISRLPKTGEIYLVSAYILPVSHSYGASTKNREIS